MEKEKNKKKTINMMSQATSVKDQGVGSAYIEQVKLVREGLSDKSIYTKTLKWRRILLTIIPLIHLISF